MKIIDSIIPGVIVSPGFIVYIMIISFGIIIGSVYYWRMSIPFKLMVQMLSIVLIAGIMSKVVLNWWGTNFPVYHILQIVQIFYFGFIFYFLLLDYPKTRVLLLICSIAFGVLAVAATIFFQSLYAFPSIGSILLSFSVVTSSGLLFYKMLKSPVSTPILKQPKFWFGAGSLFFYTITFFILGFFKFILDMEGRMPDWAYLLLNAANYILYTCYFIAIFLASKTKPHLI